MRFYLGTHQPNWLHDDRFRGVPLFVSHRRLAKRKTPYPRAVTAYAVDSGAFSEIKDYGRWTVTPEEYVAALRRYWRELGPFDWAAAQDTMCEPFMLDRVAEATGRRPTVADNQDDTVANFVLLRALAPELPIRPTVQGYTLAEYVACIAKYAAAGVDLTAEPLVGVGSVCRRQGSAEIERVMATLAGMGLRVHGFGVKLEGLERGAHHMASADSMAWSFWGRRGGGGCCPGRSGCANCPRWALQWRQQALRAATNGAANTQLALI